MSDRLLTFRDAAAFLGVDVATVSRHVKSGRIRSVDLGGRLSIHRDWLVQWVCTPDNEPQPDSSDPEVNETIKDYRVRLARGVMQNRQSLSELEPSREQDGDAHELLARAALLDAHDESAEDDDRGEAS